MTRHWQSVLLVVAILIILTVPACLQSGGGTEATDGTSGTSDPPPWTGGLPDPADTATSGDDDTDDSGDAATALVTVTAWASFTTQAPTDDDQAAQVVRQPCPQETASDDPIYEAGSDCDGDGGVVTFATPAVFKIALKKLSLIDESDAEVVLVADSGRLADAEVVDLTSEVTLSQPEIPVGRYTQVVAELYYYELTMPLNSATNLETLRIYLSDDDFPAEGNGGHHQGDIVLLNSNGLQLGWVQPGSRWEAGSLAPLSRGQINGAGGSDAETGHLRGLYGTTELWDAAEFMQGATQDVYVLAESIDLDLTAAGGTLSIVFNVAESWYFEDFDPDGVFNPCGNGDAADEACAGHAEWSPVFPTPEIAFE